MIKPQRVRHVVAAGVRGFSDQNRRWGDMPPSDLPPEMRGGQPPAGGRFPFGRKQSEELSGYEQSLGRPLTARERFEREHREKEKKPIEEEDPIEEVSYGSKHMYLQTFLFSSLAAYGFYRTHIWMKNRIAERDKRFSGETEEYDPSDPAQRAKMTDKEKVFGMPGGPWQLLDLQDRPFSH